jgi:hypothetical protein
MPCACVQLVQRPLPGLNGGSAVLLYNCLRPTGEHHVVFVQNLCLRQVTGNWVRKSVSTQLLCAEYGCRPVAWR